MATNAPPGPVTASWESDRLDPRAIGGAWRELWNELRERGGVTGELADLRASTINLITVTDSAEGVRRIEAALLELYGFAPSRVLMLNLDQSRPPGDFKIGVSLPELATDRSRPPARFELARVTAAPEQAVSLASIASPLMLPELPVYLFWPGGTLIESPLFSELIQIADRLVIDSSLLVDAETNLWAIGRLIDAPRGPIVGDFAWQRLTPWRTLLAQFFDHPDALPELERIEEVELIGRLAGKNGQSGRTAALLLAGWLASNLDWRAPGPMVSARDGWRVTLRCGSGADERELVLRIRLKGQTRSPGRVLSVMLRSDDDAPQPALFRVERVSNDIIHTYSEFGGRPPITRGVPAPVFTDSALLGKELASLGRDTIYESALRSAITLMPEEQ